jgi:LuxR family maltose regulon positive regulatory protein
MSEGSAAQWVAVPWFLSVPARRDPSCTERARLTQLIDDAVRHRAVTVLTAPSGYGKTTLLAQWADAKEGAVAWFTVPRNDGDQQQMLIAGISAAVKHYLDRRASDDDSAGSRPSIHGQPSVQMLGRIAAGVDSPLTIIIDDAHRLVDVLSCDVLERIAARSDGAITFLVSGHGSLAKAFAESIASGRAMHVGADDLAFTVDEIRADWLASGTHLALEDATALREVSAGWPIAIRAIKIAVRTNSDWQREPAGTSADEKLIAYIEQVVLAGLRPELRDFILAATTCGHVTADLARVVTGFENAAALLEECADTGIFLSRRTRNDGVTVYFWHDLFARHCRAVLARSRPGEQRRLHIEAARRLASVRPSEAIGHALLAQDVDLAAQLIVTWWPRIVIESGARELDAHCASLPAERRGGDPDILWIRAVCRDVLGEATSSSMLVRRATKLTTSSTTALLARLILEDDPKALARIADAVGVLLVELEGQDDAQPYRLFLLGWVELRLRRAPRRATQLLQTTVREAVAIGAVDRQERAQENLAFALAYGGRLSAAVEVLAHPPARQEQREWVQYDGGIRDFTLGFVSYWRGETDSADQRFRAMLDGAGEGVAYTALAAMFHALCAAASRDPLLIADARARLHLLTVVRPSGIPWAAYYAVSTAALDVAAGRRAGLGERLESLGRFTNVPVAQAIGAELLRDAGDLDGARNLLQAIDAGANISHVAASALTTAALIAHQRGAHQLAHQQFERALDVGVPEGIIRPFAARQHTLIDLMNAQRMRGTDHDAFLNSRIAALHADALEPTVLGSGLSPRQQQVYGYLCTALSVEEIAEMLGVSINTIRTHQRSIYRKLGVVSRRQAVQRRFSL